jgi:hypothetical protein
MIEGCSFSRESQATRLPLQFLRLTRSALAQGRLRRRYSARLLNVKPKAIPAFKDNDCTPAPEPL